MLIDAPVASNTRSGRERPRVVTILPSGMKMEETSTASFKRPPPLSRRSRTTDLAPLPIRLRTALPTAPWAPEVKLASLT